MLYCVELLPRVASLSATPGANSEKSFLSHSELETGELASSAPDNAHLANDFKRLFGVMPAQIEQRKLFLLEFNPDTPVHFMENAANRAARTLFADPVAQIYRSGPVSDFFNLVGQSANQGVILAAYRPGVTDAEAESAQKGYAVMAAGSPETLPSLNRVRTAELFLIDLPQPFSGAQLADFARHYIVNELVEDFVAFAPGAFDAAVLTRFAEAQFNFNATPSSEVRTVSLRSATDEELVRISKEGLLALNLEEMQVIRNYYNLEGRDPTDVELETLAQTWSEHCVHKTFKAVINYTEYDEKGSVREQREIDSLFKTFIANPTRQLQKDWIVSAFVDNAGIISFDENYDVSFKAETHNHPSALEPFGGANTGLGGVIRDVMAVSAKPIAATDVFCFGEPDTPEESLPPDVLPPERIFRGVVDGVRDYGNKMGIPTVNGAILFDRGFVSNPLVFCGTVGIAPKNSHPREPKVGDRVIVIGGRTGRDGIHGATFSSIELGGDSQASEATGTSGESKAASVVQIGNPIEEKKTLDLLLKARDRKLYNAVTDCGAGGLSSAIGEMGAELGVQVELARVPLKYAGLEPWEIWVSEAQERMVLAIDPVKLAEFVELCRIEGVEATDLGEFTGDGILRLTYNGRTVGELKMDFLHNGLPRRHMEARWQARAPRPVNQRAHYEHHRPYQGYASVLKKILADPNIASKEAVVRVYDHEVQGSTVIKPLVGAENDGPGDAAVMRPLPGSRKGLVISNGINPRYGLLDPYHMAACAVDEAVRNALAVGGSLNQMALLDNFCWGNPNVPERLGELTRAAQACHDYALAFGLPFISGKDSLNNEYRDPQSGERLPIPGTLLISAMAVIEDIGKTVTMDLKREGGLIYIAGKTRPELGGSYYAKYHGQVEGEVPKVEAAAALKTFKAINRAIQAGLVRSCHDLSEGGLAVATAEMAFSGNLGIRYDLTHVPYAGSKNDRTNAALLFSETPSRFLLEVAPENKAQFEALMQGTSYAQIGTVLGYDEYNVTGLSTATVMRVRASELKAAWQTPLIER
ncbi:MAG TPA: phosphoribosylformylglycinamidine synthase subunit PurL [Chloroflexia bacterium]|nr:phosphoribosylformylglycinamidine synthase subunit PurL [Chloroflexia bacterium]